jgi:hypothetical protein
LTGAGRARCGANKPDGPATQGPACDAPVPGCTAALASCTATAAAGEAPRRTEAATSGRADAAAADGTVYVATTIAAQTMLAPKALRVGTLSEAAAQSSYIATWAHSGFGLATKGHCNVGNVGPLTDASMCLTNVQMPKFLHDVSQCMSWLLVCWIPQRVGLLHSCGPQAGSGQGTATPAAGTHKHRYSYM